MRKTGIIFEIEFVVNQPLERNLAEKGTKSKKLIFLDVW
jgi:hypothetical protein